MKWPITIVCRPDLATGFRLAGVKAVVVKDLKESEGILEAILKEKRVGLVLVAREVAAAADRLEEQLRESRMPVFVDLPISSAASAEQDKTRAREYVGEAVRRAIGQAINLGM